MKNKDIENLLKSEYEQLQVSPMSSKISKVPIQEKPPFKKVNFPKMNILKFACAIVSCLVVLLVALVPTFIIDNSGQSELTSYILEINPTLCITTDFKDEIISICSLSSDGDVLLGDSRLNNIIGDSLDNGLKSIVDATVELGYFDNYNKRIVLFGVNNKESFAFEKTISFENYLSKHLNEHNLEDIKIDKGCMSIPDFKHRMEFDNNFEDLDKMRDDIKNRPKYFDETFAPPPPSSFYY